MQWADNGVHSGKISADRVEPADPTQAEQDAAKAAAETLVQLVKGRWVALDGRLGQLTKTPHASNDRVSLRWADDGGLIGIEIKNLQLANPTEAEKDAARATAKAAAAKKSEGSLRHAAGGRELRENAANFSPPYRHRKDVNKRNG